MNESTIPINIKEKRTFVMTQPCECGGEFKYNTEDALYDLFNSFSGESKHKHFCNKCGKTKLFKKMYPMEKTFTIGLGATKDSIAKFVGEAFLEECKEDV